MMKTDWHRDAAQEQGQSIPSVNPHARDVPAPAKAVGTRAGYQERNDFPGTLELPLAVNHN
jgi:hypothetical protein